MRPADTEPCFIVGSAAAGRSKCNCWRGSVRWYAVQINGHDGRQRVTACTHVHHCCLRSGEICSALRQQQKLQDAWHMQHLEQAYGTTCL